MQKEKRTKTRRFFRVHELKMALLTSQNNFTEAIPSQLEVFEIPPYQLGVESISYEECRPTSQVTAYNPIEFNLCAQNGLEYIDLRRSKLYVKLRVKHSNGDNIAIDSKVAPVNGFFYALFSQVDCYLQGSLVSSSNTNYSYKCMMKTLLDYGQDAKASQLTSALFYKDRSGHMDSFDTNTGLYERKKLIGNSKSLDMEGMLFHDLFEMDRYLLNMVDVKLKLFRSRPSFCLMSSEDDADYDVVIEDIVVKVCKIKVNPAIIFAHSEALKSTNAKYPYTKTVMKHITLMMGSTNAVLENIFQDVKPKRIIMGLTSTNAVNGDYQLNPWNFQHFDLQQITLYCDGVPVDGIPLKLQFNEDRGATNVAAYVKMFENCGKWGGDAGNEITRSDFNNGYALFCFDLQPHFSDANYLSLVKQGKVRLECHFASPLPETVSLLIVAENSGYFEITENRQIKVEH